MRFALYSVFENAYESEGAKGSEGTLVPNSLDKGASVPYKFEGSDLHVSGKLIGLEVECSNSL